MLPLSFRLVADRRGAALSSSSSSPATTSTSTMNRRYYRCHHRRHRCHRRRCHNHNKQLTAVVADAWCSTVRQFLAPLAYHVNSYTFLSLSLSLSFSFNPSSVLVSPSSTFRRAWAIDSPPLAINRSSPLLVSRYVAIVGQDRLVFARPHIATPFECCRAQKRRYTMNYRRSNGGATRSFRRGRRSGQCGCAARYPRYFASGPASQNQLPSTASLPPRSFLSPFPAPCRYVVDCSLTIQGRVYAWPWHARALACALDTRRASRTGREHPWRHLGLREHTSRGWLASAQHNSKNYPLLFLFLEVIHMHKRCRKIKNLKNC